METYEVVGIKASSFEAKDKTIIEGYNLYLEYDLLESKDGKISEGRGVERIYITGKKLENGGYWPNVGEYIQVLYNKYGKVQSVVPVKM